MLQLAVWSPSVSHSVMAKREGGWWGKPIHNTSLPGLNKGEYIAHRGLCFFGSIVKPMSTITKWGYAWGSLCTAVNLSSQLVSEWSSKDRVMDNRLTGN